MMAERERTQNVWWLGAILPFGLFTWGTFLYLGIVARSRAWLLWSAVYLGALVAAIELNSLGHDSDPLYGGISTAMLLTLWGAGGLHAFLIRREVTERLDRRGGKFGAPPAESSGGSRLPGHGSRPGPDVGDAHRRTRGDTVLVAVLTMASLGFGAVKIANDSVGVGVGFVLLAGLVSAIGVRIKRTHDPEGTPLTRVRTRATACILVGAMFGLPALILLGADIADSSRSGPAGPVGITVLLLGAGLATYVGFRLIEVAATLDRLGDLAQHEQVIAIGREPGVRGWRAPWRIVSADAMHVRVLRASLGSKADRAEPLPDRAAVVRWGPEPDGIEIGSGVEATHLVGVAPQEIRDLLALHGPS